MIKQRNIFDPQRIDIITDENDKEPKQQAISQKEIIELHNAGVKVFTTVKSKRKGYQDTPLFEAHNNERQQNLFKP